MRRSLIKPKADFRLTLKSPLLTLRRHCILFNQPGALGMRFSSAVLVACRWPLPVSSTQLA